MRHRIGMQFKETLKPSHGKLKKLLFYYSLVNELEDDIIMTDRPPIHNELQSTRSPYGMNT